MEAIPRLRSGTVISYMKAVLALEAVRRRREECYDRVLRPPDRSRDELAAQVATRLRALPAAQRPQTMLDASYALVPRQPESIEARNG